MPDISDDGVRYDGTIRSTTAHRLLRDAGLEREIEEYDRHAQASADDTYLTVDVDESGTERFTLEVKHSDGAYRIDSELPDTYDTNLLDEEFGHDTDETTPSGYEW